MEVLAFVGIFIKGAVWVGYGFAGILGAKTGVQYIKDYKDSVSRERS